MRILTVRQPWAWAIIHGGKDVENRVSNIAGSYRGPVAIHAGLAFDDGALASPVLHEAWTRAGGDRAPGGWGAGHRGSIIGVVDLVEVHEEGDCWTAMAALDGTVHEEHCSLWADDADVHHLVLANPRPLAEPIPYKGALGLRTIDADTTTRILAQIGA